ncbi:MAG: M20 family metallo-hydrolase [Flavobacteriales bacterium]|nr:M20 family metallo-hydrolase [Flavobacteriales bacterium]
MIHIELFEKAFALLRELIAIPSFSGEEAATADVIERALRDAGIEPQRHRNHVWATNRHFDPEKPTLLLNSHHDTVRPNRAYTRDPFAPTVEDGKLHGLGSNDAGGALVCLMVAFLQLHDRNDLRYNLLFAASAEEENSGPNGMEALLKVLPPIDCAIVGEPTGMLMAVAEKGLLVIDATATGTPGHAAHPNSDQALCKAMDDICWVRDFRFPLVSEMLGEVRMTVTQVSAGQQHNVIPAECTFVIDVRANDRYTLNEVFDIIDANTQSLLKARSFRLNPSSIALSHPLVTAGLAMGLSTCGSPTMSDQALMPFPSLKMGPGESSRSHRADEFILLSELEQGVGLYIELLNRINAA